VLTASGSEGLAATSTTGRRHGSTSVRSSVSVEALTGPRTVTASASQLKAEKYSRNASSACAVAYIRNSKRTFHDERSGVGALYLHRMVDIFALPVEYPNHHNKDGV